MSFIFSTSLLWNNLLLVSWGLVGLGHLLSGVKRVNWSKGGNLFLWDHWHFVTVVVTGKLLGKYTLSSYHEFFVSFFLMICFMGGRETSDILARPVGHHSIGNATKIWWPKVDLSECGAVCRSFCVLRNWQWDLCVILYCIVLHGCWSQGFFFQLSNWCSFHNKI